MDFSEIIKLQFGKKKKKTPCTALHFTDFFFRIIVASLCLKKKKRG